MITAIGVKPASKEGDSKKANKPAIDLTVNAGTLRYLTTTRRYLSMAVGLIVLVIGLVVGVIWPQAMEILDLQGTVAKQDKLVSQLQLKEQQLQQLPNSPTFAQVEKVNLVLPSKKPLLELLTSINKAVTTSGVSVSSIELAPGSIATSGCF
jgi:Tfp pilus assembly protein PilO